MPGPRGSFHGYADPPYLPLVQGIGGARGGCQPSGLYPMSQPFYVAGSAMVAALAMWQVASMATSAAPTATVVTATLSHDSVVSTGLTPRIACFEVPGCHTGIVPHMARNVAPLLRQLAPVAPGVSSVNSVGQVAGFTPLLTCITGRLSFGMARRGRLGLARVLLA